MVSFIEIRMSLISRVNCPERVYLSSNDDTSLANEAPLPNVGTYTFNSFRNRMPTPVLNPKKLQLLRASIPNVVGGLSIPNYQLVFWYYRVPIAGGPAMPMNIRIVPSDAFYPGATPGISTANLDCPYNRPFQNYIDFVATLNLAANATNNAFNTFFESGDIEFYYDATAQKIYFQGTSASHYYAPMGYADSEIATQQPIFYSSNLFPGTQVQPFLSQYTLNLRAGFTNAKTIPEPEWLQGGSDNYYVADSYGDLVYSQNVYLRCNIIAGSSVSSGNQQDILACIPINVGQLGVALYTAATVVWNTKLASEIYEIEIILLDDAYQPYPLPNNAICAVELGIKYSHSDDMAMN
jgi:hypothetical protein